VILLRETRARETDRGERVLTKRLVEEPALIAVHGRRDQDRAVEPSW
jgi:hypothetical protein